MEAFTTACKSKTLVSIPFQNVRSVTVNNVQDSHSNTIFLTFNFPKYFAMALEWKSEVL